MSGVTVRKVVIPAAGLGTRCLPLTKAIPKELLPIFDRPALEVVVDEARASGIDTLVLITGAGKSAIENHFDRIPALEDKLRGQSALLDSVTRQATGLSVVSIRQGAPLGLGHAVGCAQPAIGDAPFAVMLPDDLIVGPHGPTLRRLIDVFEATGRGVVLLMEVPRDKTQRYGVVAGQRQADGTIRIEALVEKPRPEEAPSNLAIVGRYVFPPSLFKKIAATASGALGEVQLTDAMRLLAQDEGLIGVTVDAKWLDTGNPLGLLMANLEFACSLDPAAREAVRAFARTLD